MDERISHSYPSAHEMELVPEDNDSIPSDLVALNAEERALVLDFGHFVFINVYCPDETSDACLPFKMNYHLMLQECVNERIKEGREFIVVGDINICATHSTTATAILPAMRRPPMTTPLENGSTTDLLRMEA